MKECITSQNENLQENVISNILEDTLREGARKMLQQAIELEVKEYLRTNQDLRDQNNRKVVKRNGYLPEREIQTGLGAIAIQQPRIRDLRDGYKFSSTILPPYVRRTPSIESVIPTLYLKGISTGNIPQALEAILGENAKGLSPTNITRLKSIWEQEFKEWSKRSLEGKRYVYIWADGIYFNTRLSDDRPCLLVIIGATPSGNKEFIAIHSGYRESKISWMEILNDLKMRGLKELPELAIGDGALGFWAALRETFPTTKEQRCWVHKTANILDKMPKSVQPNAKTAIHNIYMAPTKAEGLRAFEGFIEVYEAKFPKACDCLKKDKEQLLTFYDFPAMHWQHIRTTNPIESTFATIRHRTRQTKGCGSVLATQTMVFKLAMSAEKGWRKLRGYKLIEKIISGVRFKDGEEVLKKEVAA